MRNVRLVILFAITLLYGLPAKANADNCHIGNNDIETCIETVDDVQVKLIALDEAAIYTDLDTESAERLDEQIIRHVIYIDHACSLSMHALTTFNRTPEWWSICEVDKYRKIVVTTLSFADKAFYTNIYYEASNQLMMMAHSERQLAMHGFGEKLSSETYTLHHNKVLKYYFPIGTSGDVQFDFLWAYQLMLVKLALYQARLQALTGISKQK